MSTADDHSSSYKRPSATHRLSFSSKNRQKKKNYNTLQGSIIETYEIYEKRTRDTPSSLNRARTY